MTVGCGRYDGAPWEVRRMWRFFPRRWHASAVSRRRHNRFEGAANNVVQAGIIAGNVVFSVTRSFEPPTALDRAAERLAAAVGQQWKVEAAMRSLHRPE